MKKHMFFAGLLFLFIACNKEKNIDNNNGTGNPNTISMKNSVFSPANLQININATVTWINDDNMVHTVTSANGTFNSGDIAPGTKFTYTFTNTGTYNYHCAYHPDMIGAIIVAGIR
jgi:plastocyanin